MQYLDNSRDGVLQVRDKKNLGKQLKSAARITYVKENVGGEGIGDVMGTKKEVGGEEGFKGDMENKVKDSKDGNVE